MQIIYVFIGNTNSARVTDDKTENETESVVVVETTTTSTVATVAIDKLEMPLMTIAYNLTDNNRPNVTLLQKGDHDNLMKMRYILFSTFIHSSHTILVNWNILI